MRLSKRDAVATGLVAAAFVLYILWLMGFAPLGLSGTRAIGVVILVLGFLASASAVVPSFDRLMHGNKTYLGVTALIGLVALVAGVMMLVNASGTALAVMMVAMVVLWLISTIHHSYLAKTADSAPAHESAPSAHPAGVG